MNLRVIVRRSEETILLSALFVATALPLVDAVGRRGGFHVPGGGAWVQQMTLFMAFVGGLMAVGQGKHLTLSTAELLGEGRLGHAAKLFSHSVAAAVAGILSHASVGIVVVDRQSGKVLTGGVPVWVIEAMMPVALGLIAIRFAWKSSDRAWGRALAFGAVGAAFGLGFFDSMPVPLVWLAGSLIVAATLLGAPVFVAMGGLALLLFFKDGVPTSAVPAEIYRLIDSPTLPAIPLLTAAGYVLTEGGASGRLVKFFRALFGWMPGGMAIVVTGVLAAFTTFTGGSGVTIIALGGLALSMLAEEHYPEGFSLGLITTAGSLGLLFPPSLPVVLYSVVAGVPADSLYLAGIVPGTLLVLLVAGYGVYKTKKIKAGRDTNLQRTFSWPVVLRAAWEAKWEIFLPIFVVALFVSGLASMVETAAAALAYVVIVGCFVVGDVHPFRQLPDAILKSGALMGAVLLLLSLAMGLTAWMVDAMIPAKLLELVRTNIHSPALFLLVLNVFLLILGSVLEIFSAIVILAPLIAPMGAAFGVDPIHLGIVFLANLELGFIFPPVGLNLLLSSSRFGKPLTSLYRHVAPFLAIRAIGVLLVTYLPWLSTGVLKLLGKGAGAGP